MNYYNLRRYIDVHFIDLYGKISLTHCKNNWNAGNWISYLAGSTNGKLINLLDEKGNAN